MSFESNIKVSVIITTYKRAAMLSKAIDSVLEQTYKNTEVVIVDDNNPDSKYRKETEIIMENYKTFGNVKYIKHSTNKNGAAARNTGIKHSSGEIVCFLDDDDSYLPDKVEYQLKYLLENKQFKAVYCGWLRNNKVTIPVLEGDLSFQLLSGLGLIYTNTIMMWKKVAVEIGGWDERFQRNQEAVFLLRFFKKNYQIGVVKKKLVEFNTSDRSNVLNPRKNKELFDFYLTEHEDIISNCEKKIKNAKNIIYSYRYRGVLLAFIKQKDIKGALSVYVSMMRCIPIRFNIDLLKYLVDRFTSK